MEEQKSISKNVVATISALAVSATLAGGGIAWLTMQNHRPEATTPSKITSSNPVTVDSASINPQVATPMPAVPNATTVVPAKTVPSTPTVGQKTTKPTTPTVAQNQESTDNVWRIDDDGKKTFLVPQDRKIASANSTDPETRVNRSLTSLLASAGNPDGKLTTTIPVGTKLLSAKVLADGIHVDLSKEFTQSGGATSTIGRLGQVVYTATAQNPDAPVWITVEGKKLEVLGEAGVEIRQPITRQTYNQDFPIVPGATKNP
ncbi:GerMN domain-containing protein [Chamaesiphon sp. VAR_69_metabat_338]|uniref:GerMN domain-containing protein n=1 Tax=Chamaesiphon sp. VAR_69_metabat_338 TaxID=2964704 RepID=UPI00286E4505|nr:GerMN domain-containing protein [Chamaesiphon sp. VAR_69_metabat_338]